MELLQDATLWLAFSFAIFLFVLWKTGRKAFTQMLDERIHAIREELETAENLRVESQELLAQYQRKYRDAVKEADDITKHAKERAYEMKVASARELEELMERREAQLTQRIERMKETAQAEIREYAADLAIKATRGIIESAMDKKANSNLVDEAIKNIPAVVQK